MTCPALNSINLAEAARSSMTSSLSSRAQSKCWSSMQSLFWSRFMGMFVRLLATLWFTSRCADRYGLRGAHAVGHTFVEVGRAHDGFQARKSHALPDMVAHTGECQGDPLALHLLDDVQQRVAGAYVDVVHRLCVHKHVLRRRVGRGQRSLQPVSQVTDTGEEQIAAGAPYQKSGEGDSFGV